MDTDNPPRPIPAGPPARRESRPGASGAAILNQIVDEVERGLESQHTSPLREAPVPAYRRTFGCTLAGDSPLEEEPAAGPDRPLRR